MQAGLMIAKNKMATKYEIQNTKYNLPVYGDAGCGFLCQVEQRFLVNCSPSDGNDGDGDDGDGDDGDGDDDVDNIEEGNQGNITKTTYDAIYDDDN